MHLIVGAEDHRIKCVDVDDRRVKEGTNCSNHGQPARREDKDSTPSTEKHADIVDKVRDLIYSTDR